MLPFFIVCKPILWLKITKTRKFTVGKPFRLAIYNLYLTVLYSTAIGNSDPHKNHLATTSPLHLLEMIEDSPVNLISCACLNLCEYLGCSCQATVCNVDWQQLLLTGWKRAAVHLPVAPVAVLILYPMEGPGDALNLVA